MTATAAEGGGAHIPWDDIDEGVRPLIRALDGFPGITPIGSCEGHEPVYGADYYEGYVAVKIASLAALEDLLDALPVAINGAPNGWRVSPSWIRGYFRNTTETGKLVFYLVFGGYPLERQRNLLTSCTSAILERLQNAAGGLQCQQHMDDSQPSFQDHTVGPCHSEGTSPRQALLLPG